MQLTLFTSCNSDAEFNTSYQEPEIQPRSTTTPGSFSVTTGGILSFPTVGDFHQTVEYISTDTTNTQLNSFRASLSSKTLNKQAQIILDSLYNFLYYPSEIITNWSSYHKYVDLLIDSGDTAVVAKFGTWGEFLNKDNLVLIEGSLYKITPDKTIIILDGDLDKLDEAEELEESDTTAGILINNRACSPCDPTGYEWHKKQTITKNYSGNRHRIISTETFSNMTIWKNIGGSNNVRVYPLFVHKNEIRIEKHGIINWFCHRMHFNWNSQVWVTHNLQLPTSCPNCSSSSLWHESTGWNGVYQCDFDRTGKFSYPSYITPKTWDMPGGYCLAVKIFSQSATTTDNPAFTNSWYYYPYPSFDCSYYIDNPCPNFNWMYQL
jgi:hypothetical protein